MFVLCTCVYSKVDEVGWRSRSYRAFYAKNFTSNNFGMDLTVLVLWNRGGSELLVLGLAILVLSIQVEPELETVGWYIKARGHLSVDDALTSRHPLAITRS